MDVVGVAYDGMLEAASKSLGISLGISQFDMIKAGLRFDVTG